MNSREVSLWIDERWYNAISKHLKDETLEDHLMDVIDELCFQLPKSEYNRILDEIWADEEREYREQEASKRFAAFQIKENGQEHFVKVDRNLEFLDTARLLRSYLRNERGTDSFLQMIYRPQQITPAKFDDMVRERMDNTGKVTGAFRLDFEKGEISAVHTMNGWQRFRMKDVSAAVYYALKKGHASAEQRWRVFTERLDEKQLSPEPDTSFLTGSRRLCAEDVSFSEDVIQNGSLLNFYMDVVFDPDKMFGTHVCTDENDGYLNIYANYDMESQTVCDELDVVLVGSDRDTEYRYRLSDGEKALLLPRMDAHCQRMMGRGLEEYCRQYTEDHQEEQPAQEMQRM